MPGEINPLLQFLDGMKILVFLNFSLLVFNDFIEYVHCLKFEDKKIERLVVTFPHFVTSSNVLNVSRALPDSSDSFALAIAFSIPE